MNQEQAQIIGVAQQTRLLHLVQNSRNLLKEGTMSLCLLLSSRVYFVMLDDFCQNIFPNTPWVILRSAKGVSLLFPHIQTGLNGIFIPNGPDSEQFLNALQQIVQVIPFENAIQIPQFKTTIMTHAKDVDTNPLENSLVAVGYIKAGGEALKDGFGWLGQKLAAGVAVGGQYIQSKVEKKEDVQVSDETKLKVAVVKTTASSTFDVGVTFLKQLVKPAIEKGSEVKQQLNQKIDQSDNTILKDGREITVATWDALGNALSGLGTALSAVGDQVSTNTKAIVEKKYGQDASKTFL